jgi:hypothetical protein
LRKSAAGFFWDYKVFAVFGVLNALEAAITWDFDAVLFQNAQAVFFQSFFEAMIAPALRYDITPFFTDLFFSFFAHLYPQG